MADDGFWMDRIEAALVDRGVTVRRGRNRRARAGLTGPVLHEPDSLREQWSGSRGASTGRHAPVRRRRERRRSGAERTLP